MLEAIIKEHISKEGAIGFDEFMNLALYHPTYGYYRANAPILGKHGDFITAPEISDLFGFTLAKELTNIDGNILEFGAGSGVLATQILYYLDTINALPEKYYILELSHALKETQHTHLIATVPHLIDRVEWLDTLPTEFSGTILANEVLDAMPTKRGIIQEHTLYELVVALEGNELVYKQTHTPLIDTHFELIDGYTTEYNLTVLRWLESLADIEGEFVLLAIDYGYTQRQFYHPERIMGTLRCYKDHKADENPFADIGYKDITSWVDFSALSAKATQLGLTILGYTTQALGLMSLGIQDFLEGVEGDERLIMLDEVKQLIMPEHMGESFKIIALSKQKQIKLKCFELSDLQHSL